MKNITKGYHYTSTGYVYEETGLRGSIILLSNQTKPSEISINALPFCILNETIPLFGEEREHQHINFVYIILVDQPTDIKLSTEELSDFQWISSIMVDELNTFDSVKNVFKSINIALQKNGKHYSFWR